MSPKGVKYPAFNAAAAKAWKSSYLYVRYELSQARDQIHGLVIQRQEEYMCSSWCILSLYMAGICSGIPA